MALSNTNSNNEYDFDINNQDDVIFNGVNSNHSIDEFNVVNCDMNDLDNMDFENNEVDYEV